MRVRVIGEQRLASSKWQMASSELRLANDFNNSRCWLHSTARLHTCTHARLHAYTLARRIVVDDAETEHRL